MRTAASIDGHPVHAIHPMLVPISGFVLSFAFDLVALLSGGPSPNLWNQLAYYTMIGSILGAMAAVVPGLIDLLSLPSEIKATALMHIAINLTVVAIYVVNALMRHGAPADLALPMVLSMIAIGMLLFSGWLGGRTDFEAGVGASD
jgi:uncharacterized membrane protein